MSEVPLYDLPFLSSNPCNMESLQIRAFGQGRLAWLGPACYAGRGIYAKIATTTLPCHKHKPNEGLTKAERSIEVQLHKQSSEIQIDPDSAGRATRSRKFHPDEYF